MRTRDTHLDLLTDERLRATATEVAISTPRFIGPRMHHQRIGRSRS